MRWWLNREKRFFFPLFAFSFVNGILLPSEYYNSPRDFKLQVTLWKLTSVTWHVTLIMLGDNICLQDSILILLDYWFCAFLTNLLVKYFRSLKLFTPAIGLWSSLAVYRPILNGIYFVLNPLKITTWRKKER